jgi:hypothetical protein
MSLQLQRINELDYQALKAPGYPLALLTKNPRGHSAFADKIVCPGHRGRLLNAFIRLSRRLNAGNCSQKRRTFQGNPCHYKLPTP